MISEIIHLDESTSEEVVLSELNRLNNDDTVSGILVQVPLPKQVSEQKYLKLSIRKDVDGFHPINMENCILMSKPLYHVHPWVLWKF